jgi:hypothetical protein
MMLNPWRRVRELEQDISYLEDALRLSRENYTDLVSRYYALAAEHEGVKAVVAKLPKRDPKTGRMIKAKP